MQKIIPSNSWSIPGRNVIKGFIVVSHSMALANKHSKTIHQPPFLELVLFMLKETFSCVFENVYSSLESNTTSIGTKPHTWKPESRFSCPSCHSDIIFPGTRCWCDIHIINLTPPPDGPSSSSLCLWCPEAWIIRCTVNSEQHETVFILEIGREKLNEFRHRNSS